MQLANDMPTLTLNTTPTASGGWGNFYPVNVPFTTSEGVYYYGFRKGENAWFTQQINTDKNGSIVEMGPSKSGGTWQFTYLSSILLGGTDKPLWAGYCNDRSSSFVQEFNNDGTMGDQLSGQTLYNDDGKINDCQNFLPIIGNVPNQLVDYVALVGYGFPGVPFGNNNSTGEIDIFNYNQTDSSLKYQSKSKYTLINDIPPVSTFAPSDGYASCAYQIGGKGIIIVASTISTALGGSVAHVLTSPTAGGPYTQQSDIILPRYYDKIFPVISQGEMFLFGFGGDTDANSSYDILYLDPAQGGMPTAVIDSGTLTDHYDAGFIGYDLNNKPFTYLQSEETKKFVIYYFDDGTTPPPPPPPPPPSEGRPIPPSIDTFTSTQVGGSSQANSYVTVSTLSPDGSQNTYKPVQVDDSFSWSLNLGSAVPSKTIASATASYKVGGTPSDAYLRELNQAPPDEVDIDTVGETSISGSAGAPGLTIMAWRSSDGTRMLNKKLDDDQSSFDLNYENNQTLASNDLINVVAADPNTGLMSPFNRKPEGYNS